MSLRKTKIVCTLGPATDSVTEVTDLVQAGMDVARLNFSHGTYNHHLKIIKSVRKVEKTSGKKIGIIQDLQGPKIRIGEMPEKGIALKRGATVKMTTRKLLGTNTVLPVQYKGFVKDIKKKHSILIDDGLIELTAIRKTKDIVICKVKVGGIVKSHKGVNLPKTKVSTKSITPKDTRDLEFGLKQNVAFVALSFVRTAKDIKDLRKLITAKKSSAKIIAKIETPEALDNLESIVKEADGIMVARGDLGVEIPAHKVPIAQKRMIALANRYSKPVITATQVLQSMVLSPRPTRAEVSDAANAVFDHTDAIMLSNETSTGHYPFKATTTLKKVTHEVEQEIEKHKELQSHFSIEELKSELFGASLQACKTAEKEKAKYLIVYSETGEKAREIAKFRPTTELIVITPNEKTAHELTLSWGINRIFTKKMPEKNREQQVIKFLQKNGTLGKKYKIVIAT